jgi:hypothetical protein
MVTAVLSSSGCRSRNIAAAISVGLLACIGEPAHAQADSPRFCIVPIKDGEATAADVNQAWRISMFSFRIPGLPSLVFTPLNRRGQWTIDASRQLVPYLGSFPHSTLDQSRWVREPWSARVVAITYDPLGGGVSVLAPGIIHFEKISGGSFLGVYVLPRRKVTVVTSSAGVPLVVGDHELTPWFSREQMAAHDIHGVYSVQDAPSLNATIVLDLDRRVYVLTDDDEWNRVGSLDKDDYGRVLDAPGSKGALFAANHSVLFIRKEPGGRGFGATVLASGLSYDASFPFKVSSIFGQVMAYTSAGLFDFRKDWRRLTANEFESIPGGDVGLPRANPYLGPQIQDLPTISRTLIEGRGGFFLYDGQSLSPVPHGERTVIGDFPRAYDLASIGHVVVTTTNGMFDLTKDGRLTAMTTPFPAVGLPTPQIADWPDAGVALVATRSGLFTLDSDLVAKPIDGSNAVADAWMSISLFTGVNPGTGEMVLTGTHALFLAVDAERSHDDACRGPH